MFAIIFVLLVTLQVVRTSLMSCLLKTLKHNIDHPRPIKVLFETSNIYIFLVSVSNVVSHFKISTKKKQKKSNFSVAVSSVVVGTILFLLA
jgi:phenylalanyl-tRNA synthetase beta subunit